MRIEIPEFHKSRQPEEFLDWVITVEEILESNCLLEDKCVPSEQRNCVVAATKIDMKKAWKTEDLYIGKDEEASTCTISFLQLPEIEVPKAAEFETEHQVGE